MTNAPLTTYKALLESLEVPEVPPRPGSKRSPERDVIDALSKQFALPASCTTRSQMAAELVARVAVEEFVTYLSFLIAPFTHMFREVYDFLGRHRSSASSSQTIEEIRLGRRTRLPFDTTTFEMVERIEAEVTRTVWDMQALEGLLNPIYGVRHAAACPGHSRLYGTCHPDVKALCKSRVDAVRADVPSILAADQAMAEAGKGYGERVNSDLRGMLENLLSLDGDATGARPAEDCLDGQRHGQSDDTLYTQVALCGAQSILDPDGG